MDRGQAEHAAEVASARKRRAHDAPAAQHVGRTAHEAAMRNQYETNRARIAVKNRDGYPEIFDKTGDPGYNGEEDMEEREAEHQMTLTRVDALVGRP